MRAHLVVALAVGTASAAHARAYAPRVLSPHRADAYRMKTFARYERWRDLEGDAKVDAIFMYLIDRQSGIFPMGAGAWEGADVMYDFGYVRDPGVNNLRIYAHCLDDAPPPPAPVTITHVWTEAGARKEKTVTLEGPGGYEVACDAAPADESIEMAVPGDAR